MLQFWPAKFEEEMIKWKRAKKRHKQNVILGSMFKDTCLMSGTFGAPLSYILPARVIKDATNGIEKTFIGNQEDFFGCQIEYFKSFL